MGHFQFSEASSPSFHHISQAGEQTEKANNKPGFAAAVGGSWAAAALLAVFKIPFRPRVELSPLPCRLNVSPLFRDKVSPLFRERVSVFRLKVPSFRLKVPSLRTPLSSFLLPMLLVLDGSSILTAGVSFKVGSFSLTHWLGRRVQTDFKLVLPWPLFAQWVPCVPCVPRPKIRWFDPSILTSPALPSLLTKYRTE